MNFADLIGPIGVAMGIISTIVSWLTISRNNAKWEAVIQEKVNANKEKSEANAAQIQKVWDKFDLLVEQCADVKTMIATNSEKHRANEEALHRMNDRINAVLDVFVKNRKEG